MTLRDWHKYLADAGLSRRIVIANGSNPDIDAAQTEDVVNTGGTYTFPSTARIIKLASTDTDDKAGGTGARTVRVYGLLSDYSEAEETVTLAGTTDAPTLNRYLRVNYMQILTAGSQGVVDGNLSATSQTDSIVVARIDADEQRADTTIFTVPKDHTLLVEQFFLQKYTANSATVRGYLWAQENGKPFQTWPGLFLRAGDSYKDRMFAEPLVFPEKTDLKVRCTVAISDNTEVSGGYIGVLIKTG